LALVLVEIAKRAGHLVAFRIVGFGLDGQRTKEGTVRGWLARYFSHDMEMQAFHDFRRATTWHFDN
jgi:hypothetical protein